MRIVSWNMNRLGRSASSHDKAWDTLQHEILADLCLAQEASPPDRLTARVYRPIGAKPYNWGSAVVALRADVVLRPRPRVPLELSLPAALAEGELPDSHPAGDLNITSQGARSADNEASALFHRLRAWRLIDCIAHTKESRPRMPKCKYPDGDGCSHVRTFRTNTQLDDAFASELIAPALTACVVEDVAAAWARSDHCPVIVDLDDSLLATTSIAVA